MWRGRLFILLNVAGLALLWCFARETTRMSHPVEFGPLPVYERAAGGPQSAAANGFSKTIMLSARSPS